MRSLYYYVVYGTSLTARRLLLHLYSISQFRFEKPTLCKPFAKPGAAVTWTVAGRGTLRLGGVDWPLMPGADFFLYGTDQARHFIPDPGQSVVMRSFWFSGPGLDSWLDQLDAARQPRFNVVRPQRIYKAHKTMISLIHKRPADWEWSAHELLSAVLSQFLFARGLLAPGREPLPGRITDVLTAIECDPTRDWTAAGMARMAGMSVSAFRVLFAAAVHESPRDYLARLRLDLAKEMLEDPRPLIKEIAARLHLSKNHFTNFFHKHAGVSPTEFRQLLTKST